jgi:hypothetical protein
VPGQAGLPSQITNAAAASIAAELTKPAEVTDRWLTGHSYPETDLAAVLDQAPGILRGLAEASVKDAASLAGLTPGEGAVIGNIAARVVLSPVTAPMAKATRICEIAAIVAGAAVGAPHLVAGGLKMLAHDELSKVLAKGLTDLAKVTDWSMSETPRLDTDAAALPRRKLSEAPGRSIGGIGGF